MAHLQSQRPFWEMGENARQKIREQGVKSLTKAAAYLVRQPLSRGLEIPCIRYAALKAIADYTAKAGIAQNAEKMRRNAFLTIEKTIVSKSKENDDIDVAAIGLALSYLAASIDKPTDSEYDLINQLIQRCCLSVQPNGLYRWRC